MTPSMPQPSADPFSTATLPDTTDILVVGAGIAGLATAYGIARVQPSCRVLVVEQAPTICSVTTAAAGGGFRCWWPENAGLGRLTRDSITRLRSMVHEDEGAAALEFHNPGYIMMSGRAEHVQHYLEKAAKASAHGGGPVWLDGRPWPADRPASTETDDPGDTFDLDAYLDRRDGIDVIGCPGIIRQVLDRYWVRHDTRMADTAADRENATDALAVDKVKALLHIRNAGHLNPVALGHRIAARAMATGNVTIATQVSLVDVVYTSDHGSSDKRVAAAVLRHGPSSKEQAVHTSAIVLAVGPYLPILGTQLNIAFAVANEPHARVGRGHGGEGRVRAAIGVWLAKFNARRRQVVFNDPLAAGPSPGRSWTFWSDPVAVKTDNDGATTRMLSPNVHCRPWCPPARPAETDALANGTGRRQFTGVWTYENQQLRGSSALSAAASELVVPPPVPTEYPSFVLQGLCAMFPRLEGYLATSGKSPRQALDCVDAVHSGYYCKTHDQQPMIGPILRDNASNRLHGLWACGALSGHGIMIALGCGHLLAQRLLAAGVIQAEAGAGLDKRTIADYDGLFNVALGEFISNNASLADQM
ncbi:hypothetical protein SYNPS1DRAFT_28332 [Syncephalis pseudoplumigaleata]|uniref:FAD-dependent oxidoreductase domain-containing protein 1 n=1 Tax=Syncephalis pseudoplumigaleata TaxID=1712513 RepID=A0A4P9Z1V9_9FUNG|nr:hypothetical protein SYNPS1DRAFT_28332 [Syncephalis pseudoplumigaleata]|eukprot:RKP25952.1 hypothetical protein SYNPS1DRAFT_28332 [Syncephalis pseudoplumigaleata]